MPLSWESDEELAWESDEELASESDDELAWESDDEDDLDEGREVISPPVLDGETTMPIAVVQTTQADPPNQPSPELRSGSDGGNRAARPHFFGRAQLAALGLAGGLLLVATVLILAHPGAAPVKGAAARSLAQPIPADQFEPFDSAQPDVSATTSPAATAPTTTGTITGTTAAAASSTAAVPPANPGGGVNTPPGKSGSPATQGTIGTVDLALHHPVTASSHEKNYVPSNAVDGNPDTYWEGTDHMFPQYIGVDLGSEQTIGRVELRLPPLSTWPARVQNIQIVGDNSTLAGMRAYDFEPGNGNVVDINLPPTRTRYVRVVFLSNTGWPAAQLSALRVFAAG